MNRTVMSARIGFLFFLSLCVPRMWAQLSVGAEPQATSGTVQAPREVVPALPVPRLVKFAGAFKDEQGKPRTGVVGVTFAIYKEQEGGAALWLETQNVDLDEQGHYTVLLGSTKSEGLPLELFSAGEPRWLGVQVNLPREVEQPRVLLVSVPYALKAADADTLGGKPLSSFVLANPASGGGSKAGAVFPSAGALGAATIGGGGTQNFVAKFDATGTNVVNSSIFDTGTNVGFGTSSPARSLHILSSAPVIRLEDTNLPNSFWELQQSAFVSDTFGFLRYENGAAVADKSFVVSSAGNLGIGTGTPQRKLHIRGSAPVIRLEDTNLPNSFWELQQSAFVLDTFGFLRYENGAAVPAKSFVMSSGGNFGIGTGTPSQKLEVAGNIKISGAGNALTFPDGTVMSSAATGVGGGTITGVTAGPGLTGGGTTGGVTVGVANGGITSAMLGATAVTNANIADGSLSPAKITGTAATLGANIFTGSQTVTGNVQLTGALTTSSIAGGSGIFSGSTTSDSSSILIATQAGSCATCSNQPAAVIGQATATMGGAVGVLGTESTPFGAGVLGRGADIGVLGSGFLGVEGAGNTGVLGDANPGGVGILGQARFAGSVAGTFDAFNGSTILIGENSGTTVFLVDGGGNIRATAYQNLAGVPIAQYINLQLYGANTAGGASFTTGFGPNAGMQLPNTGVPSFAFEFTTPPNYASGSTLTVHVIWYTSATSCTMSLPPNFISVARAGRAHIIGPGASSGLTAVGGNTLNAPATANVAEEKQYTITSPDGVTPLNAGDVVVFGLFRTSSGAGDCAANLTVEGVSITY